MSCIEAYYIANNALHNQYCKEEEIFIQSNMSCQVTYYIFETERDIFVKYMVPQ